MPDETPIFSTRLPADLQQRIRVAAVLDKVSIRNLVEAALLRELEKREKRQKQGW
jgi:hypothetical protein